MKSWMRWTVFAVLGVVAVGAAAVAWGVHRSEARRARQISQPAYPLQVPEGEAVLARGRYLFASRGCSECHGAGGGGRAFVDLPDGGIYMRSPNISPGDGSMVAKYTPSDWERTLRHGIKPDGRPLLIMPAEDLARTTDADIGALVAYAKQLPPVTGGPAEFRLPLPMRVAYGYGLIQDAPEKIDHKLPPAQPVAEGVTIEHGRYVAQMCIGCHGAGFSGGKIPGGPPNWPAAANLTPGDGSVLPRYAEPASFRTAVRSGKRPDGSAISPVMPFETLRELNDTDIDAILIYLRTLAPRAAGQR